MRKSTTPNMAVRLQSGWRDKLGNGSSRWLAPLGLILMLFALFVPGIASAQNVTTTTYDFKGSIDANSTEVTMEGADPDYTNCVYFTKIGNVSGIERFAAQGTWILTEAHKMGLYSNNGGGRRFLVNSLFEGDVVTFDVVDVYGNSQTISLESTSTATASGNTFTMTAKGKLVVNITRYWNIKSITVKHTEKEFWAYDPATEIYDLYYQSGSIITSDAGFNLNGHPAKYVTNLSSGMALNNRIAISTTSSGETWQWTLDKGLKSNYSWHNVSICNLVEDDRVFILYTGQATFSSAGQNGGYNGCAAFRDTENNGEYIKGQDIFIENGMALEAKYTGFDQNIGNNGGETTYMTYNYTVTEDGHLDIGLSNGSRIVKVIIYADHQAQMVDRDNNYNTSTSYFNTTGQLEAKHHIVPGGLNVYIGNDNDSQHAEIVLSDKGPVSFVFDQNHFKMARHATFGSFDVTAELPATGTFYKFVPEVSGKMWVKFKANSINYHDYSKPGNEAYDNFGTPNEVTNNARCPYYLMVEENGSFHQVENPHYHYNGHDGYFGAPNGNPGNGQNDGISVERGKTYYLYGWWDDTSDAFNIQSHACGVAELIEVTFLPNMLVEPLAKWVEPGTTSDGDLADVKGYSTVKIKKKSANIASCEPYIEDGKLKIRNIVFNDANKGGGTILIKVGDPNIDADPVFAYTIAYNAAYNPSEVGTDINGKTITRSEGHTWNFTDKPLVGLKWNNKNAEADEAAFGPYFNNYASSFNNGQIDDKGVPTTGVNNNSFLYYEMNKTLNGRHHSDWEFNYRVKKNGNYYDPRFLNLYDMEGDNADMMWDTEGIIINASSTQSCLFDEFCLTNNREIDHTNKTQADPDRYIGFLPGGEFIIPCLKKDDRVIIYMGSGNGSGETSMEFSITNARDAMYEVIDPNDNYHAGGSMWNVPDGHNDPYYRGCYHFFAKEDGDMKFKMTQGSMCKIYTIKIYRGARESTNGIQENGGGYTILATKNRTKDAQGNITTSTTTGTNSWTLHHRGKGEQVADGTGAKGQNNEVIASSENIENKELGILRGGQNNSRIGITYTNEGEIGMLRVRVKCMEFNQKYVTDFADRNFTLALHETQFYPYTWDFTDVDLYSSDAVENEEKNFNEITDFTTNDDGEFTSSTWYEPLGRELSMWDENGSMVVKASTEEYVNQNMIFENCKGISGNQLWATSGVIPETQGLWFYMDNNDPAYNGCMQIVNGGLKLVNTSNGVRRGWWNYKMVVPAVPAGAAVYLRVARDTSVPEEDVTFTLADGTSITEPFFYKKYRFDSYMPSYYDSETKKTVYVKYDIGVDEGQYNNDYAGLSKYYEAADGSGDYIMAIYNGGAASDLHLTLNGWILKKMSISEDLKTLDSNGWATESREHVVDPSLTAFLTGYDIETCFVEEIKYNEKTPAHGGEILLTRASFEDSSSGDIVRASKTGDMGGCILHNTAEEPVKILNDGFHLFVPDMHDYPNEGSGVYTSNDIEGVKRITGTNLLKAQVDAGDIPATEGEYTNYILSNRRYVKDEGDMVEYKEAFYRVSPTKTTHSNGNNAYLQLLTSKVSNQSSANGYKLVFEFENDADGISEVTDTNVDSNANSIYSIDGKKLEGMPTSSGLYIINGKKVVIK